MGVSGRSPDKIGEYQEEKNLQKEQKMRKKIIMILAGTVLLAAVFTGLFFYQKQTDGRQKNEAEQSKKKTENSSPSREEKEGSTQTKGQEAETRDGKNESKKGEERESKNPEMPEGETIPGMELSGFPKEVFKLVGKDPKELSELVKQWTQENGFSSVTGIEYGEPAEIRFREKKCSISCRLLFGEQGNGIRQEEPQLIFLDYFWEENLLQIHR
jgi:hypothetical protein